MSTLSTDQSGGSRTFRIKGVVRFADGLPASGIRVAAFDRDLRSEQPLGQSDTDRSGAYRILYIESAFLNRERGTADLVVKALDADGAVLVDSPVLFNAPPDAQIDLTVPLDRQASPTLFERIGSTLEPLLGRVTIEELEENQEHQDLTFLSGETGFEKRVLARFALAHRLARLGIDTEFWFALLGASFFAYADKESLKENQAAAADALSTLDAGAVRKALAGSFNRQEIPSRLRERTDAWVEAFLQRVARLALGDAKSPTFARMALDHAGIDSADKQAKFARLFNEHKALTPELLAALQKDKSFTAAEIADLRTSYQLSELTRGGFSIVKMLKEEFDIRQPEQIRTLAKRSERQWVELIEHKHKAGDIELALGPSEPIAAVAPPAAEIYAKTLERKLRDAFPTTAFAGGLERAMGNGGARGVRHAALLGRIIERHPEFDLLRTPVDAFLNKDIRAEFQGPAKDPAFRLELKAVQRVFKLAPTFEAADALLADGLHSAQMVYRLGESEFVRRYAKRAGFSADSARLAWSRAADTHAAVLTVVGDLAEFDAGILPGVLRSSHPDLATFPNWENLFQSGDICHCEHCRSVLSPAAYFTDMLMFLRDRRAANPASTVKDILFKRRPDLGYLELNCKNALTTLPYVDVVCEVLERAVDKAADNDLILTGFTTVPANEAARKAAVASALEAAFTDPANGGKETVAVGGDFSLSQVDPSDPDRWVVHGDDAAYLLKKKAGTDFFAELLPNTKASSEELRAYPAYVNPKAYSRLREARFPFGLPFDLFVEEVRAAFQKSNVQRWDLMRTFRGPAAPNNPTDGEIAAEYLGVSCDAGAAFDERRLIFVADATVAGQQEVWGEKGNAGWLTTLANVKTFLRKSGLAYEELLVLIDLPFINPAGDIAIQHLDSSCDTDKKIIQGLNAAKLDRTHRFLRLWRKLNGWKMWELDLAIRCPGIGSGALDDAFLINLHYFSRLRSRLSTKTTVAQLCGLFDDLSTETHFTKLHEKRGDGFYQSLFLNKKLIQPLDPAFDVAVVDVAGPTAQKLSGHRPVILSALGIRDADLDLLTGLTRASNGAAYITDDLTLANLSFLWRHAWLGKLLKFKPDEWKTVLNLLQQDVPSFADPRVAFEFVEEIDHLKATGFTADELNWLLAADRAAKAAVKEADAGRFLTTLRTELQAIRSEYDPAHYDFLEPPADLDRLTALLTSLLQQLNRDAAAAQFFVDILRDEISQEKAVPGLPAGFTIPAAITGAPQSIRIRYEPVLRFSGVMTAAQRTVLLTDSSLAAVTALPAYHKAIQALFDKPGSPAVTGLPAGFTFPAAITGAPNNIPIRYEPMMRFTGLMTAAQRTTLLTDGALAAVTGIATYQQAIEEFFQTPRLALKFLDPVFTATLSSLPATVDFKALPDPVLALKISYDAEERALRVGGILSPDEKTALDALSADLDYRNAVNSLFTQPALGVFPAGKLWLSDADLKSPLRDPGSDPNDPANEDFKNLKDNLATAVKKGLAYLSKTLSENLVIRQVSAQLGLTEGLARRLLTDYAILPDTLLAHLTGAFAGTSGVVDYATLKTTFDGWFWASRIGALWRKWKLTLAEWETVDVLAANAQLVDFTTIPLDAAAAAAPIERVLRTSRLFRLKDGLPETGIKLFAVLDRLNAGKYTAPDFGDFAKDVHLLNDAWSDDDVKALVASLDLTYPTDYLLAESWERMRRAFDFVEGLNAGAATVKTFAAATMAAGQAKALKALLRAKFGGDTWLALSVEIQDTLRERKRDALAAYLLTQPMPADAPTGKWENTNDLYAYYLLDVEMGACQLTSRLVQASGSVQLFVQRCFMGLESDVKVQADGADGDSAWRWWKWMRKYRVWEANRKVFLWPENWIEPELKKDRSSFFKELENELLQNEVNQYTVETAFANYLEKLDGVAQLEIAGFYQEDDGDNTVVHVFGRNKGVEPHLYYYRRYDYRQWTPWEKIDLDIQGDYLVPAVVNKRLFLFWPVFSEIPDETANSTVTTPAAAMPGVAVQRAKKNIRLQMAVSDYRQGRWTPKRVSSSFDYNPGSHDVELNKIHYQFFAVDRTLTDDTFILKHRGHSVDNSGSMVDGSNYLLAALFGEFDIADCKGVPARRGVPSSEDFVHVIRPERAATGGDKVPFDGKGRMGYDTVSSKWLEHPQRSDFPPDNDFTLENQFSMPASAPAPGLALAYFPRDPLRFTPILLQTPDLFAVSAPWHLSLFDRWMLNANVTSRAEVNGIGRFAGTWLPFFYADKARSFFVAPSLGGARQDRVEGARLYYPDMKKSLRLWEAYFEGEVHTWLNTVDLAKLTPTERQQLELALQQQFHEVAPPPYPDEQVKALWQRALMRFYHLFVGGWALWWFQWRQFHFQSFYHPFACDFAKLLHNPLKGIPAVMSRETQLKDSGFSFLRTYQPTPWVVETTTEAFYPREIVDFSPDGAYSSYNWELFFHAPLLIANALSKNQRFEEARDWYHFIFNPMGVESAAKAGSAMSKYWITKPFFETTDLKYVQQRIENILRMLAGDATVPGYSAPAKKALEDQVFDWRTNPFEPHRIANYRTVAYQKTVVMKYLDNLIAWGDYLFRQDSMESINEATQLYVLAAELLGPQPKKIPPNVKPSLESFNELEKQLDAFANALVEVENLIPSPTGTEADGADSAPLPMLYFCIPHNEKMLGYWDTVADRLYKIRHCMNIDGVARQLALFEPPIDPGALVKAVAAGVDIGAALADLNAPLPLYRFNVLLQKANEVCGDVKALGGALLSALEKKDGEALSLLRQGQEIRVLEAVTGVREMQINEAMENLAGAQKNKELITIRRDYYRDIENVSRSETLHQEKLYEALVAQQISQIINVASSLAHLIPDVQGGVAGFGGSPVVETGFGGTQLGWSLQAAAGGFSVWANVENYNANKAATNAAHERRWDDWKLQERLANKELEQVDKSIAAATLRIAIAEKELENHKKQIENAKAIDAFMRSKYTNEELYQWQVGQISGVYFQNYKLAYDLAKRAERCLRFELGLQDSSIIGFGYWDSLKKGLLCGEKLQYDLRRLESAYLEQNRREFELTKHVSLIQLNPLALVRLRETGRCFFQLPEELFDLDYPGHYFRRIKSVSLTLPCVAGPYTTVSCTLRLLKNSTRISIASGDNGYPRNTDDAGLPADDGRFLENNIPVYAIAASSGQNDSGVFELNFRDERYLPFEGAGTISQWSLELFGDLPANNPDPANPDFGRPLRQFDYGSISDAVLHVRYTAREDAGIFKNGAIAHLREYFSRDGTTPSLLMLDLRRDFATQWSRFIKPTNPAKGNLLELELSAYLFPMRDAGKTLKVNTIYLLARCTNGGNYGVTLTPSLPAPPPPGSNTMTLVKMRSGQYGNLHFAQKDVAAAGIKMMPTDPPASWSIRIKRPDGKNLIEDPMEVEDVILILGYEWK